MPLSPVPADDHSRTCQGFRLPPSVLDRVNSSWAATAPEVVHSITGAATGLLLERRREGGHESRRKVLPGGDRVVGVMLALAEQADR